MQVLPPWKAIHFPLPPLFEPPCTNMILTITGFEDRERDYAKVGQGPCQGRTGTRTVFDEAKVGQCLGQYRTWPMYQVGTGTRPR